MDIEMLERLGVTDADARQIIETVKVPNTGNGPTHFIPAYDLMYYVNDVNRENTEVLTLGSRYNSDTSFQNVSVSGIPVYLLYSFLTYGYTSPSQQPVK